MITLDPSDIGWIVRALETAAPLEDLAFNRVRMKQLAAELRGQQARPGREPAIDDDVWDGLHTALNHASMHGMKGERTDQLRAVVDALAGRTEAQAA